MFYFGHGVDCDRRPLFSSGGAGFTRSGLVVFSGLVRFTFNARFAVVAARTRVSSAYDVAFLF